MNGYHSAETHRRMHFDRERNDYYRRALAPLVGPDTVVLDLGAGLGVLGFIAAELGARAVYMVEPAEVADISRQVAAASPWAERINCIKGRIEEVELPEQVDIILSVFTGNFLLTEDLLPSLFHARDCWLKPGGRMMPDQAVMELAPVSLPEFYAEHVDCWEGNGLETVRPFASNSLYHLSSHKETYSLLAQPASFHQLDFMAATRASCKATLYIQANADGTCHGLLGWFRTRIGEEWLSTAPDSHHHWRQVFMPVEQPFELENGQGLQVSILKPDFGEWSWHICAGDLSLRQSTFLSQPVSLTDAQALAGSATPVLDGPGQMLLDILKMMDGQHSLEALADHLLTQYPGRFYNRDSALAYLRQLVTEVAKT
jgi:hypothetical protein